MPKLTAEQIAERVAEIDALLVELAKRLDKHIASSAERHRRANSKITSLEERVGALELRPHGRRPS